MDRKEFSKKIKFKTIDFQEPSYATGGMIMGTYASGGYKIVEVWFDNELIVTKRISYNPMFERSDEAKLNAVSKYLWKKHGDRKLECDYEQYLPPHDKSCGKEASFSLKTKEGYKLYFCDIHARRGKNIAVGNEICDVDTPIFYLSGNGENTKILEPLPPPKGTQDGNNWISPPRPRTTNPSGADFDYIAVGYTIEEYSYSGPTPRGGFTRYCARIKYKDEIIWDGEWYIGGYQPLVLKHAKSRGLI